MVEAEVWAPRYAKELYGVGHYWMLLAERGARPANQPLPCIVGLEE